MKLLSSQDLDGYRLARVQLHKDTAPEPGSAQVRHGCFDFVCGIRVAQQVSMI